MDACKYKEKVFFLCEKSRCWIPMKNAWDVCKEKLYLTLLFFFFVKGSKCWKGEWIMTSNYKKIHGMHARFFVNLDVERVDGWWLC